MPTDPQADPAATDANAREDASSSPDGGRLGMYALLGAGAGSVPLPWIPEALLRRVRGSLLHDIATRHGVSLSPEARAVLCDPLGVGARRGVVAEALRFVGGKVAVRTLSLVGPASLVWPVGGALRTYVLGHLFDRHLARRRSGSDRRSVRIDADEARRVRAAIDAAFTRVVTLSASAPAPSEPRPAGAVDDQRDSATALVDTVIGFTAGIPSLFSRRLDAAFDEACASHGAE
jgi:hypothetical protein